MPRIATLDEGAFAQRPRDFTRARRPAPDANSGDGRRRHLRLDTREAPDDFRHRGSSDGIEELSTQAPARTFGHVSEPVNRPMPPTCDGCATMRKDCKRERNWQMVKPCGPAASASVS